MIREVGAGDAAQNSTGCNHELARCILTHCASALPDNLDTARRLCRVHSQTSPNIWCNVYRLPMARRLVNFSSSTKVSFIG